jgi:Na+/melibiose symporter-like transporter
VPENPLTLRQRLQGLPNRILVVAAALVIAALITGPLINGLSDKDRADNALLTGVPFILAFVALVLVFIYVIIAVAKALNNQIPQRTYQVIERIIIAGVVVGVVGMFQPWVLGGYQAGFLLLIACFITFNIWSHISPRPAERAQRTERII